MKRDNQFFFFGLFIIKPYIDLFKVLITLIKVFKHLFTYLVLPHLRLRNRLHYFYSNQIFHKLHNCLLFYLHRMNIGSILYSELKSRKREFNLMRSDCRNWRILTFNLSNFKFRISNSRSLPVQRLKTNRNSVQSRR